MILLLVKFCILYKTLEVAANTYCFEKEMYFFFFFFFHKTSKFNK